MYIIKLFFYLISPILFLFILIISPFFLIRLCFLSAERIGELTYQIEKYHLIVKKNKKKNIYDIFFGGNIISNNFYLSIIKKNIFFLNGIIAFPVYRQIRYLSKYIGYFKKFLIQDENKTKDLLNTDIVFNKKNLFTKLPLAYLEKGEAFLKKIGISSSEKIVLLHVRDSKYLEVKFPNKNYSYHDFRDCNINNFIPAIETLIQKGYYVFRMGEIAKNEIKLNNKKFIDYSFLHRSEFLDVYLSSRCSFVISCGGGFGSLPSIAFRKPILYANGVPILPVVLDFCEQSIYSIKLHYDSEAKRYLNFQDIIKLNLSSCTTSIGYSKKNIILEENTSEDLKDMVLEFIEKYEKNIPNTSEEIELQGKVVDIFLKNFDLYLNTKYINSKPKISKTFLKKYNFLLDNSQLS